MSSGKLLNLNIWNKGTSIELSYFGQSLNNSSLRLEFTTINGSSYLFLRNIRAGDGEDDIRLYFYRLLGLGESFSYEVLADGIFYNFFASTIAAPQANPSKIFLTS
jgi:hypothetical protein